MQVFGAEDGDETGAAAEFEYGFLRDEGGMEGEKGTEVKSGIPLGVGLVRWRSWGRNVWL